MSGCTTYGSTPTNNSPSSIVNAIKNIYNNRYTTGYNTGYDKGKTSVNIVTKSVSGTQGNFSNFGRYSYDRSLALSIPIVNGYTRIGQAISTLYLKNTNSNFSSATFELIEANSLIYVISHDISFSSGSTSVTATVIFYFKQN